MQVIIFPQESGGVSVVTPAPEFADQIEAVAQKDVPYQQVWIDTEVTEENPSGGYWMDGDKVYRVIDIADLPDHSLRARWRWTDEGPLDIADETPPPPAPVPNLSFAQLLIGLVTEAWITEPEGEAWLAGTLPMAVLLVIDGLPAEQRFAAKARALRPSEVLRGDPLVAAMGTAAGKTEAEIDTFFQTYAGV
jgi:hypothetical protein